MWRPGSPQSYQPPSIHAHSHTSALQQAVPVRPFQAPSSPFQTSRLERYTEQMSRPVLEQTQHGHVQPFARHETHSSEGTRPGTPPSAARQHLHTAHAALEPSFGYQPLLEPLLPVSDLLQSSPSEQPAQDQQTFTGPARPPARTQAFPMAPSVPAPLSPLQRPLSHHSHSPQPSEPSLQDLNVPLEPHERQLLNNLLHRSYSMRSQDRGSDHSHSSASTHLDSQPLSLPPTWSGRRLSSSSLMTHDTTALQDPHDLSR